MFYLNSQEGKMLRRFTSVIVLALLVASIFVLNVRLARSTTVLSQNFDDEPTGSVPQGWTVQDPSYLQINDTVYYGSSGKSARYSSHGGVNRTFENQYGYVVLSFEMRAESPAGLMLYIDDGSEDYRGANIYFIPEFQALGYYDGDYHPICPFTVSTWYQIKLEIDVPTNTYDIYVDGSLKAQGAHFRGFGQTTYLNVVEFGGNSLDDPVQTPTGFIDDVSIVAQEHITPVTPIMKLSGSLDYLLGEDVKIKLDGLVKDAKTMKAVSDADVTIQIYYPNGSLWVSDVMLEKLAGTGIYEWESSGTIREMNLEKGVYLAYANASTDNDFSTDILLFHVDPNSGNGSTPIAFELYTALTVALVAGTIIGTFLLRQQRKWLLKNSRSHSDTLQTDRRS